MSRVSKNGGSGSADAPPPRMAHDAQLVVRTISTIGNYDYIFDLRFLLDGSIKVKIFAAGYDEFVPLGRG